MKYLKLLLFILTLSKITAQSKDEQYIANFAPIAVQEMQLYKIPASITLAQGLLETADGQSELAQNANNHFGIKCKQEWTGETYRYTDDAYKECFRKYSSALDSYRDHSKFLAERPYYKNLFNLNIYDYKAWAYGLKKAGYATNPRYAQLLISKIEQYNLHKFDYCTPENVSITIAQLYPSVAANVIASNSTAPVTQNSVSKPVQTANSLPNSQEKPNINVAVSSSNTSQTKILQDPAKREHPLERMEKSTNKNLKFVRLYSGETLYQLSKLYKIPTQDLMEYNEISDPKSLKTNDIIYLQNKKNKGVEKYHIVQKGETLHSISQLEGVKLEALYKRNRMNAQSSLTVGEQIYLKGKKKK